MDRDLTGLAIVGLSSELNLMIDPIMAGTCGRQWKRTNDDWGEKIGKYCSRVSYNIPVL